MKSLILDVDGVLVRDRLLLEHVKSNVVNYVRSKLPTAPEPAKINRMLYARYGHTGIGLNSAFGFDVSDFNEKVYNNSVIDHLWSVLSGPEFQEDASIVNEIQKSGWDVTLFSNSPLIWTLPVQSAISDNVKIALDGQFYKPDIRAYMKFSSKKTHLFVDDKEINLRAAKTLKNWIPVMYSNNSKDYISLSSVWDLCLLTNTINEYGFDSLSI
jgi:hypothetical protein